MHLTNFNFAQPIWLWGLLLIPAGWGWWWYWRNSSKAATSGLQKFIDQKLISHLLLKAKPQIKSNRLGFIYTMLVFSIIIALSNPRWSYKELDAFAPTASMVILLDLSATMSVDDVTPSRIVRARQNIEDLLNLSNGLKFGLIGFAGTAHLISPITDDIQTIKTYIPALDTDLTNLQGRSLPQALHMAIDLLAHEPGDKKSILLVSDGNGATLDFVDEIAKLSGQIQVHVIGIGTAAGAPYKNKGKMVVSKLNSTVLQSIAKAGQGVYTETIRNDSGIRAILSKAEQPEADARVAAGKIRQWDDQYFWFVGIAAGLLLYLMQQRVLYVLIATFIYGSFASNDVLAFELKDLFVNAATRGQQSYVNGDFNGAAQSFGDAYHKGVALYRAGQYAAAEEQFGLVQREPVKLAALYNAGNAQMQQRRWRAAIKSYEAVLQVDPEHFAAAHNLAIARKMLDEEDEQEEPECECNNPSKDKDKQGKNKKDQEQDKSDKETKDQQQEQKQEQKQEPKQEQKSQEQQQQQAENKQADPLQSDKQDNKTAQHEQVAATQYDKDQVDQLLNRVDSDIKVFLKNKFYIEDVLSAQKN